MFITQKYVCISLLSILLCLSYYGHALGVTNKYHKYDENSIFNVRDYGAKGDGIEDDTKAFQKTWASTCKVEHGVMLVPSKFTFLLQPITFSGNECQRNIKVQVDGEIIAPSEISGWKNIGDQWILFSGFRRGLTISGNGVIDGRGEGWWKNALLMDDSFDGYGNKNTKKRPYAIRICNSNGVVVMGITIKNSPNMHIFFDYCQQVTVSEFTISSPKNSPNTDGIHLSNTRDVDIHHATLACGDDCISIQTGCSNITIYEVHCGPGHGFSIGSLGYKLSEAHVSNIGIYNSTTIGTSNGVRIKTWEGATGSAQNITFENIIMSNVENSIVIDQYYCEGHDFCKSTGEKSSVAISGITYKNITGTYTKSSVTLVCSENKPCRKINMDTIDLNHSKGMSMDRQDGLYCSYAYGKVLTDTNPSLEDCLKTDPAPTSKVEAYEK